MNIRRKFVLAIGAGALMPLVSFAQQRKVWRIGFLADVELSYWVPRLDAFKSGMSALGYTEGKDFVIESRSAQSDFARLPVLAAELVALKVDVILTSGTPTVLAASKATREIPIVTTNIGDLVGSGLAASLARPGGNVSGMTSITTELTTKRLDLLRQILPKMRRVGLLYDPNNQSDVLSLARFEADCAKLKLQPIRAPARKAEEIATAFMTLERDKAQAVIVPNTATNNASLENIVKLAAKYRLPAAFGRRDYAEASGLLAYAPDHNDLWRRAAAYVDKIFRGAKIGDLPIEQPTRFDFVLNMKTAKALGLKIPGPILAQATKVIE